MAWIKANVNALLAGAGGMLLLASVGMPWASNESGGLGGGLDRGYEYLVVLAGIVALVSVVVILLPRTEPESASVPQPVVLFGISAALAMLGLGWAAIEWLGSDFKVALTADRPLAENEYGWFTYGAYVAQAGMLLVGVAFVLEIALRPSSDER